MKKNIVLVVCIVFILSSVIGCENKNDTEVSINEVDVKEIHTRTGVAEGKDGWMYIVDINGNINGKKEYLVDAYNYKYNEIEGYGIKNIYADGSYEIFPDNTPALCQNENNIKELRGLEELMNSLQCEEWLDESYLEKFDFNVIDKNCFLEAYYDAVADKRDLIIDYDSKYLYYPAAYTFEEYLTDGTRVSVGYCNIEGFLRYIYIGIEYGDGTFLEDTVNNGAATEEQKQLHAFITEIENKMVELNKFDVTKDMNNIEWNDKEELKTIAKLLDYIENMAIQ